MSDYICEELIIEIFTKLPPKSLMRFRSLCKSWYNCISSPAFIRLHTSRATQKLLFRHQLHSGTYNLGYFEVMYLDDFYTLHSEDQLPLCPIHGYNGITPVQFPCSSIFKIIGSCNGIVCLSEYKIKNDISLWNPSIRRKVNVPNSPRVIRDGFGVGLGFGFDPISDDYKIVQISYARESSFFYALKTRTWSAIASPTPLISNVSSRACFVNGMLHWVVDRYHSESHHTDLHCIMTFDLRNHVFGMIPLPEPFGRVAGLTTLQASLGVICIDNHNEYNTWIWVRRDDSWSVVFKLKANQFTRGSLVQLTTNGDLLLDARSEGIQVYITNMGAQSTLVNFHAASFIDEIVCCVESLHLLDIETVCEPNQLSISQGKTTSQLSVSHGKKTSKFRYLNDLFYYYRMAFILLFNMRR